MMIVLTMANHPDYVDSGDSWDDNFYDDQDYKDDADDDFLSIQIVGDSEGRKIVPSFAGSINIGPVGEYPSNHCHHPLGIPGVRSMDPNSKCF